MVKQLLVNLSLGALLIPLFSTYAAEHHHSAITTTPKTAKQCTTAAIACAKTVTSAFANNGDLWRIWVFEHQLYQQISTDKGASFSNAKKLPIAVEKISARNENRPKIAFDGKQGVYLSWAMPREKKYTADVRFSYSKDYGQSFTTPITVNNDNLLAGHSFNELNVSDNGDIRIVWLDSRLKTQMRQQGKKVNGSELYYAQANWLSGNTTFSNKAITTSTCVCCRIATDVNNTNDLVVLWRHIYGDNIREFALTTIKNHPKPITSTIYQVSHDHWQINGCPHQGGGISVDHNDRYHLVWFNIGDTGKGIFYANTTDQGKTLSTPLLIGDFAAQSAHPHIKSNNKILDIIWTQFSGDQHQLWHQRSLNEGKSFNDAKMIASSKGGSDRPFIIQHNNKNYVSWQRPKQGHWFSAL